MSNGRGGPPVQAAGLSLCWSMGHIQMGAARVWQVEYAEYPNLQRRRSTWNQLDRQPNGSCFRVRVALVGLSRAKR